MDGTLLESTETKDDTTISIEWYGTGQKRWESKTVEGKVVSINRWHEDGKIRKELYDWEEEAIKEDNYYSDSRRPLNYIIKPKVNLEKQDVLFFMHGHGGHIGYYEPHIINQFSDNYVKIVLRHLMKHLYSQISGLGLIFISLFFSDTTFNEEQINASCDAVLFSIDKIIEKERINLKEYLLEVKAKRNHGMQISFGTP